MVSPKISGSSSNLPPPSNSPSSGNPPPSNNPPPLSSSSNPPPSNTPPQRNHPLSNQHPPANNPQSSSHPPSSFHPIDARGSQEPSAERADDAKEGRSRRGFGVLKRSLSTSSPDNKQAHRHTSHNPQLQLAYPWIMDVPVTWSWNSLTHTWSSVGGVDPESQGWWGGFFDRRRNSFDPWGPPLTPGGPNPPGPALPWWHGTNKILFYNKHEPYYGFTNFSNHPVMYERKKYPTSEHLFQSFKFIHKPKLAEHIRTCSSRPSVAFSEARRFAPEIRQDWGDEKIKAMEITLYHKFTQHKDLKRQLLGTEEKELVENSDKDSFWGCGPDGKGKNELGKALERLRDRLREERR